eukprot:CFRG4877T1
MVFMLIIYFALAGIAFAYIFGLPKAAVVLLKAAFSSIQKRGWQEKLKDKNFKISSFSQAKTTWTPDADKLDAYCKFMGVDAKSTDKFGAIPIVYPQVALFLFVVDRLSGSDYALPMLGMVHVSNFVRQVRPLRVDETYTAVLKVSDDVVKSKRGTIVEYNIHLEDKDGLIPWTSTMTVMHPHRVYKTGDEAKNSIDIPIPIDGDDDVAEVPFELAENTGRKYAAVSNDYNPIHMHPAFAKIFGFKKHIAHGLYMLGVANAKAMASDERLEFPIVSQIYFKRPTFLPCQNVYRTQSRSNGIAFTYNTAEGVVLQEGEIYSS